MAKPRRDTLHDERDLPFQIDNALIDRYGPQVGAYGIAVYIALARFAKRDHATVLAYQTIADAIGVGKTTVRDAVRRLADAGVIRIEQQTDDAGNPIASNRYILLPINDRKAENTHRGGVATRQGVSPHDTPLPPDDGGVPPGDSPYRHTDGGVPPHEYIDHDSILYKNLDSPPPPWPGGGDDGESDRPEPEKPERSELYHWLRQHGVDSPAAAERNQHHDLAATQAFYRRIVGDALGEERAKRIGRFIRALDKDGPPPAPAPRPAPAAPAARPQSANILSANDIRDQLAAAAPLLERKKL